MTETAVAPALNQAPPQGVTKAEAVAKILEQQNLSFDKSDYDERLEVGKRRAQNGRPWNNPLYGLFSDPSINYTLEKLKALVPLDRDKMRYKTFAKNVHGLLSIGRAKGRRKPRMTKHQQAIKSESIRVFRGLIVARAEELKAVCKNDGIEYLGIPDALLPEISARAAKLGMAAVNNKRRAKARKANRVQQASRKTNRGK
jgi:hypothetical protein